MWSWNRVGDWQGEGEGGRGDDGDDPGDEGELHGCGGGLVMCVWMVGWRGGKSDVVVE